MINNIIQQCWGLLNELSLFLLVGFLLAGVLNFFVTDQFIKDNLSGRGIINIIKATLIGIPIPLCSCGVIPVAMSLYKKGASKSSITSFLISTPQTGVDSLMVTYAMLGPIFMIVRPITSLITGIFGGVLVKLADNEPPEESSICKHEKKTFRDIFNYGFNTLPQDIAKPLLMGIFIASLISIYFPQNILTSFTKNPFELLLVLTIAISTYVCATASIPIVLALINSGLSVGAGLVFLMAGPVTNMATIGTVYKVLGKKVVSIYVSSVIIMSLIFGYVLNIYDSNIRTVLPEAIGHHHHIGLLNYIGSVFLLLILLNAIFKPFEKKIKGSDLDTKINVSGMTCNHCTQSVTDAVLSIENVSDVNIDLDSGNVFISGENINMEKLYQAIEKIGFKIIK